MESTCRWGQGRIRRKYLKNYGGPTQPDIADQLAFSVDIAHRLGPRSGDARSNCLIIVQFLSQTHRDKIWKDARTLTILKERKIKIFEDLTQDQGCQEQTVAADRTGEEGGEESGLQGTFRAY